MNLREALDLCSDAHADEWVEMPSGGWGRPASTFLAGLFDPGASEPDLRPLVGHSIAVYEPDARLSMVWPVPDEAEHERLRGEQMPEWAEADTHEWSHARDGWVMILLGGAPIWQARQWYLDWGSGIGGYVADFQPRFGGKAEEGRPQIEAWEISEWEVRLARLINSFSATGDFFQFDLTDRVVPSPSRLHPADAARGGY